MSVIFWRDLLEQGRPAFPKEGVSMGVSVDATDERGLPVRVNLRMGKSSGLILSTGIGDDLTIPAADVREFMDALGKVTAS